MAEQRLRTAKPHDRQTDWRDQPAWKTPPCGPRLLLLVSILFLFASGLPAQETTDAADEAKPPIASGTQPGTGPPERIIYLPYNQLEDVFDRQNSSVIIPYPEYLRLWTKAEGGAQEKGAVVDAVITRADYVARVEEDVARIQAEFTIQVVGKPWVEVPLEFGDAAVGAATSQTGEILLRGTGNGRYTLLLKDQGEQHVSVELATPVVTSPDGRQIAFHTPAVAVTTLELVIPQADQDVEVQPRLVRLPVEQQAGQTRVKASLGATPRIAASWHARASSRPQMELLASVNNLQRVSIADGLIHTDAALQYRILRGELEQVRIVVPKGRRVLDITASARLEQWQVTDEDQHQLVTVDLLAPVTDQLTVEIHTESRLEQNEVTLAGIDESGTAHGVHALDVVRESGQLVVTHGDDLTLRVSEQSGLVRIEPEEVAASIRQEGALAYKFFSPQFVLQIAASPVEPRVTVVQTANVQIREEQIRLNSGLTYEIQRAGVFELRLQVPAELDVTEVDSEAMQEYRVEDGQLIVSLRQRMTGTLVVTVAGERPLPEDGEQFELPLLEPLGVERERGVVNLFARDAVEVATNDEELEAALPEPLAAGQQGTSEARAAWRFTRRPVKIPITVTRRPTRLSAQVATDVDVQPTRTRVTTLVDFLVEYAGIDAFRIDVPEAAMPTLQIEAVATEPSSPALRETTAADPVDGWVTHTLTMQRPLAGRQRFRLTYDLQPKQPPAAVDGPARENPAAAAGTAAAEDAAGPATADAPVDTAAPPATDDGTGDAQPVADTTLEQAAAAPPADTAATAADAADPDTATPAESAGDEAAAVAPEVPRLQTSLWIIRPRGLPENGAEEATELTFVTGEVRLMKEESLTITAEASGDPLEAIDVRELGLLPATGTMAFRYREHGTDETLAVTVTQARYDVQEMIATVVSRAVVEIVLGDRETASYRCRYRIKSTERQRLELRLPKGIQPLAVRVNNTEIQLEPVNLKESAWDLYAVNVARSGESDEAFQLTLQFQLSFSEPPFDSGFLRGRIRAPLPIIGATDGSAATQELRTIVWIPQEYALIGDPPGFVLDGDTSLVTALLGGPKRFFAARDDDAWVGYPSASVSDFPTAGRVAYRYTNLGGQGAVKLLWWDTVKVTVVVSLALAIIALVLVRTDWENKLGILLLIAFGAVLLGLKNLHVLAHALSAMRFGLAFLIGLWLIHGLFGHRQTAATAGASRSAASGVTTATPPHAAAVPPPGVFEHFLSPRSSSHDDDR